MSDTNQEKDETKFNDTLKRMLKTPPKPHGVTGKSNENPENKKEKPDEPGRPD